MKHQTDLKLGETVGVFYTSDGDLFTVDCADCEMPVISPFVAHQTITGEATGEDISISKCLWCVGNDLDQAEAAGNYRLGMAPTLVPGAFEWYLGYALRLVEKEGEFNAFGQEDGFYIDADSQASDFVCGDCGLDLTHAHMLVMGVFDTKGEDTTRCHGCVGLMVDNAEKLGNREIESQLVAVSTATVRWAAKVLKAAKLVPADMGYGEPRERHLSRAVRRRRGRESRRGWRRLASIIR